MIIYKLNEINERIDEMRKNIKGIQEKGEAAIQEEIQKYNSQRYSIKSSRDLTESGKENEWNKLSHTYYDNNVAKGKILIDQILEEYDKAIERVKELKQFDDEKKIVNDSKTKEIDVIKENTNLMYAICLLNNIDKDHGHEELKKLLEQNQESEKILNLIKMKSDNLFRSGAKSEALQSVKYEFDKLDKDYVKMLEEEKLNNADYYRNKEYPRVLMMRGLREIFEVDKTDISKFSALNKGSQGGINKFFK